MIEPKRKWKCKKCDKNEVVYNSDNKIFVCLNCKSYWKDGKYAGKIEKFEDIFYNDETTKNKERIILICPRCQHKWFSKSELSEVCCPHCLRKSPRENFILMKDNNKTEVE